MILRRILTGNRRFRVDRVVGTRTVVQTLVWSVIVVGALTVYRTPSLLDGSLTVGAVVGAVPIALLPLVIVGVAGALVVLNAVRELQYLLFGGRRGRPGSHDSGHYDDDGDGGLFDSFGGFGGFGGGDGDGDGD